MIERSNDAEKSERPYWFEDTPTLDPALSAQMPEHVPTAAQSSRVRAETIEECAKIADNVWHGGTPQDAAEAIRALAQPSPAATVETKSAPELGPSQNNAERLPQGDQAGSGAGTQCSAGSVNALIEALMPFSEAADWYDATQNCLDDDAVVHKEKHGLGALRINVRHLREARRALRTFDEPQTVLGWLATKTNYELSYSGWDNEDPTWDVHSVNGGRNDREWTLLATGSTPEEALRKAMSLSLTRPQHSPQEK